MNNKQRLKVWILTVMFLIFLDDAATQTVQKGLLNTFIKQIAIPFDELNRMNNYVRRNQYLDCPVNEQNQGTLCLGLYDVSVPWIRDWTMDDYFCGRNPGEFGVCGSFWYFLRERTYEGVSIISDDQWRNTPAGQIDQLTQTGLRKRKHSGETPRSMKVPFHSAPNRNVKRSSEGEMMYASVDEYMSTIKDNFQRSSTPHYESVEGHTSHHHHSHLKKHQHHLNEELEEENLGGQKRGVSNGALPIDFIYELELGVEWLHRLCTCHCGCTRGCYEDMPLSLASVTVCGVGKISIFNSFNLSAVPSDHNAPTSFF